VHPKPQIQIEYDRSVLDQQIRIARSSIDNPGPIFGRLKIDQNCFITRRSRKTCSYYWYGRSPIKGFDFPFLLFLKQFGFRHS